MSGRTIEFSAQRLRWKRLLGRTIAITLLVVASTVALARPAAADICADAPPPVAPKSGLPGMLTPTPQHVPDKAPDPFTDKGVSIGQVYGYNWHWSNYDLGCGPDFLRDPVAVTNTQTANVIFSIVGAVLAGLASLEQMAKTSSLDWLTTVIGEVAGKLRHPLLSLWLPLAMFGVGLIGAFRAKRSSYAETMRTLMIIGVAATMAVFALVFPAMASKNMDRAVVSVSDAAGAQFSGSPTDAIARGSAYRTWLAGNFSNPDSAVAQQLGPQLLDATHYSWSDMKRIQADPSAKKQIDDAKAAEFKSVAADLKTRDPAGYEMFSGRGERTGPAMFGVVVAVAMSLFVAIAMIMLLVARVMMQGLALAAPLAAVVGVLPTHRSALSRIWDLFTAALLVVAKFVIAGGVMTIVLGAISSSDKLGAGAQLFWIVIATVVGLVLTGPIRSFKTVIPGLDPNQSYLRTAMKGVAGYLGTRLAVEDAMPDQTDREDRGTKADDQAAAPKASQSARESLPALPSPDWSSVEQTHVVQLDKHSQTDPSTNQSQETGRVWPGVVAAPSVGEFAAAPFQLEASPSPVRSDVARRALPASETGADADLTDSRSPAPAPDLGNEPADEQTHRVELEIRFVGSRPTSPAESDAEVIYPTGVIVADEQGPLYRRSQPETSSVEQSYIPMTDLDLAEDGTEHELVRYHSQAGAGDAST